MNGEVTLGYVSVVTRRQDQVLAALALIGRYIGNPDIAQRDLPYVMIDPNK